MTSARRTNARSGRRRRLLRGALAALAVLLLATAAGAAIAARSYPGVSRRMVDHAREATLVESENLFACIAYWIEHMEKLRPQPNGLLGFNQPEAYGDRGLERCVTRWHRGELAAAARCVEAEIAAGDDSSEALLWLGMSYLRLAEQTNCRDGAHPAHGTGHTCALPLARHHDAAPAAAAAQAFGRLAAREGDPLARWLASFSALAAGGWPDEVPERLRADTPFVDRFYGDAAAATRRRHAGLAFADRAAALGVAVDDAGRGVAVEDFDGDGWLDLATGGAFESLRVFRNRGGGAGFEEVTSALGLDGVLQPFSVTAVDYDGDGWMDLFVARPFDRFALYRNLAGRRFVEVTEESGLWRRDDPRLAATWTAAWGDLDRDGDLDVFLAQWGMALPFVEGILARPRMDSALFENLGGGRFAERTVELGLGAVVADEYFVGASWGDYDDDGWPDLFLSSPVRAASTLLRNEEGRRFVPVPLPRRESGFYSGWLDVDHDGRLDLFQGGFGDARTSTAQTVFGEGRGRWRSGHSTILRQRDDGGFEERNDFFADAASPMATMGAGWGDLDNDGCHDFYLGTGNPEGWFVLPNLLYRGVRDGRGCSGAMEDVSALGGFASVQKGHGIVFFDFDGDGDQDVYSALGGMWPADAWPNQLFVNESDTGNSWLAIRLRGRDGNRFGVGGRIRVVAAAPDGTPIVRTALLGNGTGFGSSPYLAHVGLLDAERVERVEVTWPSSRCTGVYAARLDQLNVLDEADCLDRSARTRLRR
jgi:hypothetical protein